MTHKEHFGKLPDHEVQTGLRYSKLTRTPNQSLPSCKINLQLLAETITTKSIVHTIQRFQTFPEMGRTLDLCQLQTQF